MIAPGRFAKDRQPALLPLTQIGHAADKPLRREPPHLRSISFGISKAVGATLHTSSKYGGLASRRLTYNHHALAIVALQHAVHLINELIAPDHFVKVGGHVVQTLSHFMQFLVATRFCSAKNRCKNVLGRFRVVHRRFDFDFDRFDPRIPFDADQLKHGFLAQPDFLLSPMRVNR